MDKYNVGVALLKEETNGNFKKINVTETVLDNKNKVYTENECPE